MIYGNPVDFRDFQWFADWSVDAEDVELHEVAEAAEEWESISIPLEPEPTKRSLLETIKNLSMKIPA